jgi:hypothetical protein
MIFRTHPLLHIAYIHIARACAWGKLSHPHKRRPASSPQCIKCTLGNNHDVHARVSTLIFMLKFVGLWEVMYATFACRTHPFASEILNKIQRIKYGVVVSHRLRSFVGQ